MSRPSTHFRQSDITRAIRAAQSAGLIVTGAKIDASGVIEVICSPQDAIRIKTDTALDHWLNKKDIDDALRHKA